MAAQNADGDVGRADTSPPCGGKLGRKDRVCCGERWRRQRNSRRRHRRGWDRDAMKRESGLTRSHRREEEGVWVKGRKKERKRERERERERERLYICYAFEVPDRLLRHGFDSCLSSSGRFSHSKIDSPLLYLLTKFYMNLDCGRITSLSTLIPV